MTALSAFTVNDPRVVFDPERHTYTLGDRELPSVTAILGAAGVADFSAPWFADDVLTRGSLVHRAIQLDTHGDLDEPNLDPALVPYLAGWRAFLADTGAAVEWWEQIVSDPALGYAGTLDGILARPVGGRIWREVVDVKRAYYPSVGPQTAAYRTCAYALYTEPVVLHRSVVVLPGDGTYRYRPLDDPIGDEHTFLAALRIFHWRRAHAGS